MSTGGFNTGDRDIMQQFFCGKCAKPSNHIIGTDEYKLKYRKCVTCGKVVYLNEYGNAILHLTQPNPLERMWSRNY